MIKNDHSKNRFFNTAQNWTLSKNNECYVCEKHTMTLVFYDRNFMALNEDLHEIKNVEML